MKKSIVRISKLMIIIAIVIGFIFFTKTMCKAASWKAVFPKDTGWDGGAAGTFTSTSKSNFSVKLKPAGTGGVWSCRVKSNFNLNSTTYKKYDKYKLSFKVKSSDVDKYIYVVFGLYDNLYYRGPSKWIKLPKGQKVAVEHEFNKGELQGIYFGVGGDAGDRNDTTWSYDVDAADRYAVFDSSFANEYLRHKDLKSLDCGGDFSAITTISVSSFKIEGIKEEKIKPKKQTKQKTEKKVKKSGKLKTKLVFKYAKSKKKGVLNLKWKKAKKISGYQFCISTNKEFKKDKYKRKYKRKKTRVNLVGCKRRQVYYIKGRVYKKKNKKTIYGEWSKTRKVVIK